MSTKSVRSRVGLVLGTVVTVFCLLLAACGGSSSNGAAGSPSSSSHSGY